MGECMGACGPASTATSNPSHPLHPGIPAPVPMPAINSLQPPLQFPICNGAGPSLGDVVTGSKAAGTHVASSSSALTHPEQRPPPCECPLEPEPVRSLV